MRTTIELPDEIFRQVKARAALEGRMLKDLITEYVERGLAMGRDGEFAGQPTPRRRSPLPVIPKASSVKQPSGPALSNAEIQAILDEEDAEHANRLAGR